MANVQIVLSSAARHHTAYGVNAFIQIPYNVAHARQPFDEWEDTVQPEYKMSMRRYKYITNARHYLLIHIYHSALCSLFSLILCVVFSLLLVPRVHLVRCHVPCVSSFVLNVFVWSSQFVFALFGSCLFAFNFILFSFFFFFFSVDFNFILILYAHFILAFYFCGSLSRLLYEIACLPYIYAVCGECVSVEIRNEMTAR